MKSGTLTLGLVLTLRDDPIARDRVLCMLAQRDDVLTDSAGAAPDGLRLPIALETQVGEDRAAVAALEALPGVVFCDVVYAHFEDCEDAS